MLQSLLKRSNSWGGARHFKKPSVDADVLFTELNTHRDMLQNLGSYERHSRGSPPCAKGLVALLDLVKALLKVESCSEIHSSCLRKALQDVLKQKPALNTTVFAGKIWVNFRAERLGCILTHVRTLARCNETLQQCAMELTAIEFLKLQEVVQMVTLRNPLEAAALVPAVSAGTAQLTAPLARKLVAHDSIDDMFQLDDSGFPKILDDDGLEPDLARALEDFGQEIATKPSSGDSKVAVEIATCSWDNKQSSIRDVLGYTKTAAEKPQTLAVCKKPAANKNAVKKVALTKDHDDPGKAWVRLRKTVATNPARSYICGTKMPGQKLKLIVEVSEKMSSRYKDIIERLLGDLKDKNISKAEALKLRADLCKQFP